MSDGAGRQGVEDDHAQGDLRSIVRGEWSTRARLWPQVTADHKNYAGYQTETQRRISLVFLEPTD
jgi:hypothetical protein